MTIDMNLPIMAQLQAALVEHAVAEFAKQHPNAHHPQSDEVSLQKRTLRMLAVALESAVYDVARQTSVY